MSVEIEAENARDIVEKAAFWHALPSDCPICHEPVRFFYREPKDNSYWGMHCLGTPKHETNFGVYKEIAKGLYYKGDKDWHTWSNGRDADDAGQPYTAASEPRAEHERLDKLIADARRKWPDWDFVDAVRKQYGCAPDQMTIAQKRSVLQAMGVSP